jgi:hypothetical protein
VAYVEFYEQRCVDKWSTIEIMNPDIECSFSFALLPDNQQAHPPTNTLCAGCKRSVTTVHSEQGWRYQRHNRMANT